MSEQFLEGSASAWDAPVVRLRRKVTVKVVAQIVAKYYGQKLSVFLGERRFQPLVRQRQLAMFLADTMTAASFPQIGRIFNRDHTTVMHACRVMPGHIETNEELSRDYAALVCAINEWADSQETFFVAAGR